MKRCSPITRSTLLSPVLRVLPLLWVSACGGFTSPPQDVVMGLALTSSSGIPPRLTQGERTLVLTQLRLSGAATVGSMLVATLNNILVPLDRTWIHLADGAVARGTYQQVSLELSEMTLEGTWSKDSSAPTSFSLSAKQGRAQDFKLKTQWRVEVGTVSTVSLVSDPRQWMSTAEGQNMELIDPTSEKAGDQLMDRFFQSLTAARDDNRDGVEDVVQQP